MKVLIDCVPLTIGGGVQVAIGVLAGFQRQSRLQWAAAAPNGLKAALPEAIAKDPRLIFVARDSYLDRIRLVWQLHRIEAETAPDVVFTVFGPAFFRARAPHLVGFALPHMIYDRNARMPPLTAKDRFGVWCRGHLLRRADHLVVETETARQRLVQRLGIGAGHISVVGNSPNALLRKLPDEPITPERERKQVIFVPAAYYWHKNLECVPEVAAQIRRIAPDLRFEFRLTLPTDGEPWNNIRREAGRLGVDASVVSLGTVPITDLARAYHEASVVFLPTLQEVSTAVYPESFFFDRPLVTTDMDFSRELCLDAASLVPPRDAAAAAARIVEILRDPARAAALVEAGRRRLATGYPSAEAKFEQQVAVIEHVARRYGGLPSAPGETGGAAAKSANTVQFHDAIAEE